MRSLAEQTYQELIASKKHLLKFLGDIEKEMDKLETGPSRVQRLMQLHRRAAANLDKVGNEMNRRAEQRNFA